MSESRGIGVRRRSTAISRHSEPQAPCPILVMSDLFRTGAKCAVVSSVPWTVSSCAVIALMAGCLQEARERWNFDFVTETPLEGNFVWERVRSLGLPKVYLSPGSRSRDDLGGDKRPSTSSALLQGPAPEDHVALSLSCTLVSERPEDSPGGPGTSQGRKRRQTSLTDFYHSKRRLVFCKRKP